MTHALDPHCDLLLVGESVAMAVYGMVTIQEVILDMMVRHCQAVMRRRQKSVKIIYLLTGSFADSSEQALAVARRVLDETDADRVKLEGCSHVIGHVDRRIDLNIAVLENIGLFPKKITLNFAFVLPIERLRKQNSLSQMPVPFTLPAFLALW